MTWGEVKLATLQKMFSAEGNTINVSDESTKEYLNAMPQAANEAMQLLATAGKFIRSSYTFSKQKGSAKAVDLDNELPDCLGAEPLEIYRLENGVPQEVTGAVLRGKYLVLDEALEGTFELFYDASAPSVRADTADSEEIGLPNDAVVLLPLYMAAELYKEDDIAIATYYRNEFETAFERLRNRGRGTSGGSFTSVTGWW